MHFLTELVKTPKVENPTTENMKIHRHFYRYSRGEFIGPAIKITKTSSKITLKGSHEYEDLIQEIVAKKISEETVNIKGSLITGTDISEQISNYGLSWVIKKSSGKTKNFKSDIDDTINVNLLLRIIDELRNNSYLLISFTHSTTCKVTTKKRIPQPSKKKTEDDELDKRIQFCTGVIPSNNKSISLILDSTLSDFKDDASKNWKSIAITNNYYIKEIELPKNVKNSQMLRILAIRKGKLVRSVVIDGEMQEKQYSIVV